MSEPTLLVIGGCNGSGKSTFSKLLVPPRFKPFDYDLQYLKFYATLRDIDIRENMAHNMAFNELERQIEYATIKGIDFCYETNFNSTPLHWPGIFKSMGYKIHLIYLCLESVDIAKNRVAIRVENGGHFVSESEIEKRYFDGYANLNLHFKYFDLIDAFDTSTYGKEPSYIFSIEDGLLSARNKLPEYLTPLIPEIAIMNKFSQ